MVKAKEYLLEIQKMDARIDADIEELAQLQSLAEKTTSVLGGERVQASGNQDKMADCTIKIMLMKQKINAEIESFIDYKAEAREMISKACDANCIKLLSKRYIGELNEESNRVEYRSWEEIAVELGFTYQWVSDGLHQRALAQLQKQLDKEFSLKNMKKFQNS